MSEAVKSWDGKRKPRLHRFNETSPGLRHRLAGLDFSQRGKAASKAAHTMDVTVTTTINGITRRVTADPARSILDVLREDLRGTGSGHRCGRVRCGGCVILLDNRRVLACDTPIIQADQRSITTIESDPDCQK